MTLPLAHLGHWYVSALYIAPLVVVAIALKVRDRREAREEKESGEAPGSGSEEEKKSPGELKPRRRR